MSGGSVSLHHHRSVCQQVQDSVAHGASRNYTECCAVINSILTCMLFIPECDSVGLKRWQLIYLLYANCRVSRLPLGKWVYVGFDQQPEASHDDRRKWNRVVVPRAGYPGFHRRNMNARCTALKHHKLEQRLSASTRTPASWSANAFRIWPEMLSGALSGLVYLRALLTFALDTVSTLRHTG